MCKRKGKKRLIGGYYYLKCYACGVYSPEWLYTHCHNCDYQCSDELSDRSFWTIACAGGYINRGLGIDKEVKRNQEYWGC